jgi:hypothetical protein
MNLQKSEAHTPAEWAAINYPKKSAGHIFFVGDIEYIQLERNVYACNRKDPVECTGTRNGRYYSTITAWPYTPVMRLQRFQASGSDAPAPVPEYERD